MILTINNQEVKVRKGQTLLDVAEKNNIYIPHLCAHPELTPYGGCRLCIVEVEGMRGYPTSCTTLVEEGMVIRTNTKTLQEMRKEVLQLILSEHPAACLICEEAKECASYQETIKKVGVITGCRWCPNDNNCELQDVVDYVGVEEITFPVYYRGLTVETSDPFYDRDYNLCIYCARCVRICDELRNSFVLSLKQRGRYTEVGPAFGMSHMESGCEFCGACISVCPTGALYEKNRKWWGVPDKYMDSICPLCSEGCDIQIVIKNNKVIGTLPQGDPHGSGGELCVKGRFCLNEYINHPDRLLSPWHCTREGLDEITWEQSIKLASEKFKTVKGEEIAVYISPDLTIEDYAAAKVFSEEVLKTKNVTSSALSSEVIPLLSLMNNSISTKEIGKAGSLFSIFFNGNYTHSPITLSIKRSAEKGTPYIQIGWGKDTTSRFAKAQLAPPAGKEKMFFRKILHALESGKGGSKEIMQMVTTMKESSPPLFIIGMDLIHLTDGLEILECINKIVKLTRGKVMVPHPYVNLKGLLSLLHLEVKEKIDKKIEDGKIKILYLVGDVPFDRRPKVDFIVHQHAFPPPPGLKADMLFPAATWGELSGSYAGRSGKVKKLKAAVKPPGKSRTCRGIFAAMAKSIGKRDADFSKKALSKTIPKDLKIKIPHSANVKKLREKVIPQDPSAPYYLVQMRYPHIFSGMSLNTFVSGINDISPIDTLIIHPKDAVNIGVKDGESAIVKAGRVKKTCAVKLDKKMIPSTVFIWASAANTLFNENPIKVHVRGANV